MGYLRFISRNLRGRPARTTLTALGLSVAVSAVMLLTGISWGFERSFLAIYRSRGIDLIVVRAGISDQLSSNLDASLEDELRAIPGVSQVAPSLMDAVSFEEANLVSVLTSGWEPGSLLIEGLRILEGRPLRPGDRRVVLLGRVLAMNLGKSVGEPIDIAGERFEVVGIYESASLFENGGLVMPLAELQRMMGREGQVTGFVVVAAPGVDPRELGRTIERRHQGVAAVPSGDYVKENIQLRLARAMASATTAIALVLGSIGLLNTMAMAVAERTGEIGLLRALGWRRSRIILLLMGEAGALGLLGVAGGAVLAAAGARGITMAPTSRGFIEPNLSPLVLAIGLAMGLGLTLLGGLYPAVRASRLEPTEALRHE
ncbi:ABC transporter permease [Tautonia sociabilis]|uniref:ABC transporter permease n=1 Tax=Tautonia sociabilis TaxID=2080755 RepID=A0A432MJK3_9BACT|nr:ABC transporter permease [Tautonia sociabilis]RUL87430.1 ABC transporter permease [Tautonia sociabilis]